MLDAYEVASQEEAVRLLRFMRFSGLIEKRIADARQHKGWRRHRALVALGRTRAPEGIRALAEGLRDRRLETRLAALRGLGQMACPEAAKAILTWVDEAGLVVPALPLQSALVQTCAERPQLLLPHLQNAETKVREVLGRVLGEVATSSLGPELFQFAVDGLPELRAAAARGLACATPKAAIQVLSELAKGPVWFVRLRAIVSLGQLRHPDALPCLLSGLQDSNRLVRLRAAEGLVDFKEDQPRVFEMVASLRDKYGLHAYLTALENAGLQPTLHAEIEARGDKGLLGIFHDWDFSESSRVPEEISKHGSVSIMTHFLGFANQALFFYYLAGNLAYLAMLLIAFRTSATHHQHLESIRFEWIKNSPMVPPITLLVPAHNEEKSIGTALRNLLDLDYPELEVIVVNVQFLPTILWKP